MPERPLILFPTPERADREQKNPVFTRINKPSFSRQYNRLQPAFKVLQDAFAQKTINVQQASTGINPDFALVFEIIGSVDSFYTAVKNTEGLEWMFDKEAFEIEPDDDFYNKNTSGERLDETLNGKVYCVMSNQQALNQLLSLWKRYQNGETDVFKRGFAGLRNIFVNIKDVRRWSAQDRIEETNVIEYWRESLELDGDSPVRFEIELFFRNDAIKRNNSRECIINEIGNLHGSIVQECIIPEIFYHGMLVELPRNSIESLVNNYEAIELSQVDDIMFFRPTCQSSFTSLTDIEPFDSTDNNESLPQGNPIVAVFDGMPMQNHKLLAGRVLIDDPDDFAHNYESKNRIHGTSMVSLVVYGDINKHDNPINTPVYVRPVLVPKEVGPNRVAECVSDDYLFIDVIHRAVKRMVEGESDGIPTAPNTRIINISIGDSVRQLAGTMSPIARLLDYLSYKYKILFIISAGNHAEITDLVDISFDDLKSMNLLERNNIFGRIINDNQRNLKVLSPAESLNSLTIGAIYDDFSSVEENEYQIFAVTKGMPSPISAIGKGYRSIITPDLFYYGGRKLLKKDISGHICWMDSSRAPGCLSAAPYGSGTEDGCAYSFGTSDAAAQITHEAAKCYDVLRQIYINETGDIFPVDHTAILIKSMLAHSASWETIADKLSVASNSPQKKLGQWLGNGIPNIDRVIECTKERITLIGMGALKKDEGDIFRLPLPIDFSSRMIKRKLTVTLSYLSPVETNKQLYRGVQLWFNVDDGNKHLVPNRLNTDWQSVRKGTLQHEIFVGENPVPWNDDEITVKVSCKEDAGKIERNTTIPYCLFVSFEVAEGYNVDLYTAVSTKVHQQIPITNM